VICALPNQTGDNGSRSPQSAYFAVHNLVMNSNGGLTFPTIGKVEAGVFNTLTTDVAFTGESGNAPLDRAIVVEKFNFVSDAVISAAWGMVAVLLLVIFFCLIWVMIHWQSRVVKHSQGMGPAMYRCMYQHVNIHKFVLVHITVS
jgi:hypothetical protein